jgi:hypothetical protein
MRHRAYWPLMGLLALALTACNFGPTPTPEPPTPTPRARAEQIARATEVAAQITATAAARGLPTATPTPRAEPTLVVARGTTGGKKAVPAELQSGALTDGARFQHPEGLFALTIPLEWQQYPAEGVTADGNRIVNPDGVTFSPLPPREAPVGVTIMLYKLAKIAEPLPLSDITNALMAQRREFLGESYEVVHLDRVEVSGHQIDRHTYRGLVLGELGQQMDAYLVVGDVLHLIVFSGYPDDFEANKILFDAILASYSVNGE